MVGARRWQRACWAWCCLLLLCTVCQGQGVSRSSDQSMLRSTMISSRALANTYKAANARKAAEFGRLMTAVRSSCSSKTGQRARLCAAALQGSAASLDADALRLAMGPSIYSASSFNFLSPVRDQGRCSTCVPFTIAGAAEIVAAKALGMSGSQLRFSVQDIGFCPVNPASLKFCSTGTDLASSMGRLLRPFVDEGCLPYTIAPGSDAAATLCKYRCQTPSTVFTQGGYSVVSLSDSIPLMQFFIRRYGAVMTRLNIYSDFKPFFKSNPKGIYDGRGCSAGGQLEEEHAVVLVGYDNVGEYWIARNSWGPKWGDGGYLRIKYGVCGVGATGDTFGLIFTPNSYASKVLPASPDPSERGCFAYKASQDDTLWSLADALDVDTIQLLANNSGTVENPTRSLAGKTLSICSVGRLSKFALPSGSSAWSSTPAPAPAPAPKPAPVPKPVQAPKPAPSRSNPPAESKPKGPAQAPAANKNKNSKPTPPPSNSKQWQKQNTGSKSNKQPSKSNSNNKKPPPAPKKPAAPTAAVQKARVVAPSRNAAPPIMTTTVTSTPVNTFTIGPGLFTTSAPATTTTTTTSMVQTLPVFPIGLGIPFIGRH